MKNDSASGTSLKREDFDVFFFIPAEHKWN